MSTEKVNFKAVVPARYASTRFPGKPNPFIQSGFRFGREEVRLHLSAGAENIVLGIRDRHVRHSPQGRR